MSKAIIHMRKELTVGDHLYRCFCDSKIKQEGWRRIQAARRLARKLKLGNLFA